MAGRLHALKPERKHYGMLPHEFCEMLDTIPLSL